MTVFWRIYSSAHFWTHQFPWKIFIKNTSTVIGAEATIIAAVDKMIEKLGGTQGIVKSFLESNYWGFILLVLVVAMIISVIICKPATKATTLIKKRETNVNIVVGDIFETDDTLIIGINCTFDTDTSGGLISPTSLQAQYTEKYFGGHENIDTVLERKLTDTPSTQLKRAEKKYGKLKKYSMGTTVKLTSKGRDAYIVTNSVLNSHGVAASSFTDLQDCLAGLWQYIYERGGGLPKLRMPIISTGMAKIDATREEVIREILRSFFAACSSGRFCQSLTIVISPEDYVRYKIDLISLGEYLGFLSKYTIIETAQNSLLGTEI